MDPQSFALPKWKEWFPEGVPLIHLNAAKEYIIKLLWILFDII